MLQAIQQGDFQRIHNAVSRVRNFPRASTMFGAGLTALSHQGRLLKQDEVMVFGTICVLASLGTIKIVGLRQRDHGNAFQGGLVGGLVALTFAQLLGYSHNRYIPILLYGFLVGSLSGLGVYMLNEVNEELNRMN